MTIEVLEQLFLFALIFLGVCIALFIGFLILRGFARKRKDLHKGHFAKKTYLVTVPKFTTKKELESEDTTASIQEDISIAETFYAAIGGLSVQKGFSAWFYGRSDEIALEIVAKDQLISFYITVPVYLAEFMQQQLLAQYPDASITEVEDFNMFSPQGTIVGGYIVAKQSHALPLKTYKNLESDPLNALTNTLAKVPEGDGVAIQYILRSAPASWRDVGMAIVKRIQKGEGYEGGKSGSGNWMVKEGARQIFGGGDDQNDTAINKPVTQKDQNIQKGVEEKMSKAGMEVNIRIIAASQQPAHAQMILDQILQSFGQFNLYEIGNSLKKDIPGKKEMLIHDFIYRRYRDKYRLVLNTEEMASLWHLPGKTTETPNIRWMLARTAPLPSGMPKEGLHLGYNQYRGVRQEVYLKPEDRRRHTYMIGKTGSGKSYFLRYMALQDIKAGKGVCVIDPHGDLADAILGSIPKERMDDVIYFNPSDMERPMGLNMLEAPDENMRDFAVQEMISIFYMLFPPEMIGPMFEHNMRNFMLTLMADLQNPGTLAEIPRMISDDAFQKRWIAKVKDPVVRSFWEDEMAKTSDYHKSEMMGYLVSKVGRFVENEMMRNIIGQSHSAFNFRQIMDEGKILLVNLSKGQTGEVNANLLGLILVSKIQMAAFGRADMPEEQRKDFYLYIDEFQNFITPSIATILSEARKYRLNLVLAHQYMGQLVEAGGKTEIRDAVLGNVGNMLVARVGPEDTDTLEKIFAPTFSAYDLQNTEKFTWSARVIVDNDQMKPFTLKTVSPEAANPKIAQSLKEISRLTYGKSKDLVEREIALRAGIGLGAGKDRVAPPIPTGK